MMRQKVIPLSWQIAPRASFRGWFAYKLTRPKGKGQKTMRQLLRQFFCRTPAIPVRRSGHLTLSFRHGGSFRQRAADGWPVPRWHNRRMTSLHQNLTSLNRT